MFPLILKKRFKKLKFEQTALSKYQQLKSRLMQDLLTEKVEVIPILKQMEAI